MDAALDRLRARPAAEICAACDFESDVTALVAEGHDAAAFLQALRDRGDGKDAVRFLCHALEPAEAVWLAWDVAGRAAGGEPPAPVAEALAATQAWLSGRADEQRRAAYDRAERCGLDQPAACAAMAAFFAEGSLAPADLEETVPPPPGACASLAVGALLLAAVAAPAQADERADGYVARWFELAATPPPWRGPADDPPPPDVGGYHTTT